MSKECRLTQKNLIHYQNYQSLQNFPQPNTPHCRICLQQDGRLIQLLCSCIGDLSLAHQQCLSYWVQIMLNHPDSPITPYLSHQDYYQIPCQICPAKILLQLKQKSQYINYKDIKKPQSLVAIICILTNISILIVVTYLCIKLLVDQAHKPQIIIISVLILTIGYFILGWIINRELHYLRIKRITQITVIKRKRFKAQHRHTETKNQESADFVLIDESNTQKCEQTFKKEKKFYQHETKQVKAH